MGLAQKDGGRFLEALLQLNNDYLGMGLSAIYLNSGTDRVVGGAILKNKKLVEKLQGMNGEAQRVADAQSVANASHYQGDVLDGFEQDWMNENARRQREYVDAWREEKWAKIDAADAREKAMKEAKDKANKEWFEQNYGNPGSHGGVASVASTSTVNPGKAMANAGTIALTSSAADGPFIAGEVVGAATIVGTALYIMANSDLKTNISFISIAQTGSAYTYLGIYAHFFAEHTKGARPSTQGKHEKGQARKAKDRGGEKGDSRRGYPNKKPNGWKGPWPPQ